jgi:hypothetical protein
MRRSLIVWMMLLGACRHAPVPAPSPTGRAAETQGEASERCAAQRAENRRVAEASRCTADEDCVRAGKYETGSCDAWVTGPAAEGVLRRMRVATDEACRDGRVSVTPACMSVAASCVSGRCAVRSAAIARDPLDVVAVPEDPRCVAEALMRMNAETKLPTGRVELRFPLSTDGTPPRYFEAVGPVDPDAAVEVARASSSCRWRLRDGGAIPPGVWGTVVVGVGE